METTEDMGRNRSDKKRDKTAIAGAERGHLLPDTAELGPAGPSESVSRAVNGSGAR
jgi:hypothetical protein